MITTKGFKLAHSLSNSAFTRLVNRVKAAYPDLALTRRINSTDWEIIDPELFESHLPVKADIPTIEAEDQVIIADLVDEVAISIANPLDSYSPLAAYQSKTWSHTDTSDLVEAGKNALANLTFSSTNNQNAGIAALLEHERNEGAILGLALAQVKLGTANQVKDEVINDYLKKHGISVA